MNKKISLFILILFIGIGYLFNIERDIHKKLVYFNNYIQTSYNNTINSISSAYSRYINQIDHIKELTLQNEEYQKYKILYEQNYNLLTNDKSNHFSNSSSITFNNNYTKVKALSYIKLNDFSKIVLDINLDKDSEIYALITPDGYSAGTVMHKNNKTIAFLNQNDRCNYTVYIGNNKSPGITSGMLDNGNLIINYVPIWKEVKVGDKVITSGMDNLFPFGINVGVVVSFKINENTQQVLIKPYAKTLELREFYIYGIK